MPGVDKVAVSLTHEQALVEYDPAVARPEQFLQTLRDIGYTISDPRKLRPFEEEERELVREARRFVFTVVLSVAAIPIIADPAVGWIGFLPALVCLSLRRRVRYLTQGASRYHLLRANARGKGRSDSAAVADMEPIG
jgi:Cu+-exporting ATPase